MTGVSIQLSIPFEHIRMPATASASGATRFIGQSPNHYIFLQGLYRYRSS